MIKSKSDERDIMKEQQEKLGLCIDEMKNLERQRDQLQNSNIELQKELERVSADAFAVK